MQPGDDLQLPEPESPWWVWFTPGPDTSWGDVLLLVGAYAAPVLVRWLVS
jgi:hypothetical protein